MSLASHGDLVGSIDGFRKGTEVHSRLFPVFAFGTRLSLLDVERVIDVEDATERRLPQNVGLIGSSGDMLVVNVFRIGLCHKAKPGDEQREQLIGVRGVGRRAVCQFRGMSVRIDW